MKKSLSLILLLSVFTALLVGLFVAPSFIDWSKYAPRAQDKVAELTGYSLVLGDSFGLAFLPVPKIYAHDVKVSVGDEDLLSLGKLEAHLALAPLFRGDLVFTKIDLDRPVLALKLDAAGEPLWLTDELRSLSSAGGGNRGGGSGGANVSLDNVRIRDGEVSYGEQVFKDLQLDLQAQSLHGPFEAQGSFDVGGQGVSFEAKAGAFDVADRTLSLNLEAVLAPLGVQVNYAGVVAPDGAQGELAVELVSSSFKIADYDLKGGSLKALVSLDKDQMVLDNLRLVLGDDKLEGRITSALAKRKLTAELAGSLPEIGAVHLAGDVSWGSIFALQNGSIKMGDTALQLSGSYDPFGAGRPVLRVDASANNFDFDAFGGDAGKGDKTAGEKSPLGAVMMGLELLSLPMDVEADIGVQKARISGQDIKGLRLSGKLGANNLVLSNFSAIDLVGLKIKADGRIENISKLSGLFVNIEAEGEALEGKASLSLKSDKLPLGLKGIGPLAIEFSHSKFLEDNVSGNISLDLSGERPELSGDLAFGLVDLGGGKWSKGMAESKTKSSSSNKPSAHKKGSRRWSSEPFDLSWMGGFDADLSLKALGLKQAQWDFKQPSLRFKLKDGVLDVSSLKAGLFGGQAELSAQVNSGSTKGGLINMELSSQMIDVDAGQIMRALVGSDIVKVQGKVTLSADLKGSGASERALISSLAGSSVLKGGALLLTGFDVARFAEALSGETRAGDTLLGIWGSAAQGGSTAFDSANGSFKVQKGVVNIEQLALDGKQALVETAGKVRLLPWMIDTTHKFTLKGREDVPPFTVNISGSLDKPAQTFAQGAINDYLTRKVTRKLEKLLMDKLGLEGRAERSSAPASAGDDSAQPLKQQVPASPEEAFRGLLEGLMQ